MKPNCVKRLGLVNKKPDMPYDDFIAYWMGTHAELCKKLPNMLRYSVNLVDRERFPEFPYDGFSELWFESEEALVASLGSPEGAILMADIPNFVGSIYPILSHEYHKIWK